MNDQQLRKILPILVFRTRHNPAVQRAYEITFKRQIERCDAATLQDIGGLGRLLSFWSNLLTIDKGLDRFAGELLYKRTNTMKVSPRIGLGDKIERGIGRIPGIKKLPCYDELGNLKPESGCGKAKARLNAGEAVVPTIIKRVLGK